MKSKDKDIFEYLTFWLILNQKKKKKKPLLGKKEIKFLVFHLIPQWKCIAIPLPPPRKIVTSFPVFFEVDIALVGGVYGRFW